MADVRYTDDELERAKEFLRERIRNEQSMEADVETLLEEYARYILKAMSDGATDEDLYLLIEDLVSRLMEDCRILAMDEHKVEDDILPLIFEGEDGDTVEDRVRRRAMTFLDELNAVYSAGEILDMDDKTILSSVVENFEHPWDNELLVEVREKINRGEIDEDIEFYEERHYGKGVPISSKLDIELITVGAIVSTWNEWSWRDAFNNKAKGYYVERGSSYPCSECDSHTGVFYPIADKSHLPQYHRNCRCFAVYVYDDDDII